MTTPSHGPRPVGPPPPPPRGPTQPPGSVPPGARPPTGPRPPGAPPSGSTPPPGTTWTRVYRWDSSGWRGWPTDARGRPGPTVFGILLVLVGIGLLIELAVPALSFFSLVILAAGIALGYAWLVRGALGATVPALVLIGWAAASLGSELGVLPGDGWTALFVGLALLVAGVAGRLQRAPRDWALWVGALVALIGLADASDVLPTSVDFAILVPLAIVGLGVFLIWRNRAGLS